MQKAEWTREESNHRLRLVRAASYHWTTSPNGLGGILTRDLLIANQALLQTELRARNQF